MGIQYLPVSWNKYHALAQKLAAAILGRKETKETIDEIVAISRGGLTLGHLLSDLLRVPVSTITIQSYTDIQTQGEAVVTAKLQRSIRGKRILLVDDVADSGKTLKRAASYLRRSRTSSITTATLFYKPRSMFKPDHYAKQTIKWILFPYEVVEWITTFSKKLLAERKSTAQIQRFLKSLGYTDQQIAFARRHYLNGLRDNK